MQAWRLNWLMIKCVVPIQSTAWKGVLAMYPLAVRLLLVERLKDIGPLS